MDTRTVPHAMGTTLVTGATSGIGRSLVLQLAAAGATVVAVGRDPGRLAALAARSDRIDPVQADVADTAALPAWVERVVARHPALSCVVHNAGVQHDLRFDDPALGPAQVGEEVVVNLLAPMLLTRALLPHLRTRPEAVVVGVSSVLGYVPKPRAAAYGATKAGLRLFLDGLRAQTPPGEGLRFVEVVMPLVATGMTAGRAGAMMSADDAAAALVAGVASGRPVVRVGQARAAAVLARVAPWALARVLARGERIRRP